MKELDRIKQEVAKEQYGQSWEQAYSWEHNMWPIVCLRYAQLVAENALKEAAENATVHFNGMEAVSFAQVEKSSITNPKNVKLI